MRVAISGVASLLFWITACVSDAPVGDAGKPVGTLGGPCLPSNGCDTGLVCVDSTCQKATDSGASDSGPMMDGGCGDIGALTGCGGGMTACITGGNLTCTIASSCTSGGGKVLGCTKNTDCLNPMVCCLDMTAMMVGMCPDQFTLGTNMTVTSCKPMCPTICGSNADCSGQTPHCHPAVFAGGVKFGVCGP